MKEASLKRLHTVISFIWHYGKCFLEIEQISELGVRESLTTKQQQKGIYNFTVCKFNKRNKLKSIWKKFLKMIIIGSKNKLWTVIFVTQKLKWTLDQEIQVRNQSTDVSGSQIWWCKQTGHWRTRSRNQHKAHHSSEMEIQIWEISKGRKITTVRANGTEGQRFNILWHY